jgi:hypothetical protein
MANDGDYVVSYRDGRWHVLAPSSKVTTYPTQQAAIDAAKLAAVRELVDVTWSDREGKPQGRARFRPEQRLHRSFIRSLIDR